MKWPMNRSLQLLKPPTTPSQHLSLIRRWNIVAATVLLIFLQKEIAAKTMEFIYLKQIQLPNDVSWIVPSHLQPCYPSYGTMQLTNVLKNTTVRYRISATQLKLHGIVCLDKGLLCLFPASLIPFSLAHSPELNDWGNSSRKPYNSTLFNLCNLGRIYSLHCNSRFVWMCITLM